MNELQFTFEQSPWEMALEKMKSGDSLSAVQFLALVEQEEESAVEDALQELLEKRISLDLSDLPKPVGSGASAVRLRQEEQLVQKGGREQGLEDSDPLKLYLQELRMLPAVPDRENLMARISCGDAEALNLLTGSYLPDVVAAAEELAGRGVLMLDLIQEGSLGLWEAVQNWNTENFDEDIRWEIRQKMAGAVVLQARASGVGQKLRQTAEDYRAVDERLLSELGRNATLEEIAEQLHLSVEETATVKKLLDDIRLTAQAKPTEEPEEPDPDAEQAVEDTAYFQSRQRIAELLSSLSEQEAKLLTLRFGLEGGLPKSPEEAGKILNMTPEEVVSMEAAALARLRTT